MTAQQLEVGDTVVAITTSGFGASHYTEGTVGVVTDTSPDTRGGVKVAFPNWEGWPHPYTNVRKATPVEAAEYNLSKAQAELDKVKAKAEEESQAAKAAAEAAKLFTEDDVKTFTIVLSPLQNPRMVVMRPAHALFLDNDGEVTNIVEREHLVSTLNQMYTKTDLTAKDFFNV